MTSAVIIWASTEKLGLIVQPEATMRSLLRAVIKLGKVGSYIVMKGIYDVAYRIQNKASKLKFIHFTD